MMSELFQVIVKLRLRGVSIPDIMAICNVPAWVVVAAAFLERSRLTQDGSPSRLRVALALKNTVEELMARAGVSDLGALEWAILKDKLAVYEAQDRAFNEVMTRPLETRAESAASFEAALQAARKAARPSSSPASCAGGLAPAAESPAQQASCRAPVSDGSPLPPTPPCVPTDEAGVHGCASLPSAPVRPTVSSMREVLQGSSDLLYTPRSKKAMALAHINARKMGASCVCVEHLLAACVQVLAAQRQPEGLAA